MLILALDTTTRAGSAAVLRDGRVLHELAGDPALTHGQRLPGELMRVLDAAGVRIEDVDLFAVAAGPGSFTGLRVGIATMQGLAMARGRRVVPVSTLEALARRAAPQPVSRRDRRLDGRAARRSVRGAVSQRRPRTLVGPTALRSGRNTRPAWQQQHRPASSQLHRRRRGAIRRCHPPAGCATT